MDRDPLIAPLTSSPLANGTLRTMIELTKSFTFEAAHTLSRVVEREASLRIHGHSYRAEVTLAGEPDPESGMLIDLGLLDQALEGGGVEPRHLVEEMMVEPGADVGEPDPESGMLIDLGLLDQALADIRARLDHHFLDEVPGLYPATLERLARFIFEALAPRLPGLVAVAVCRDALGERCLYRP